MAALPACLQPRLGLEIHGFVPAGCIGYLVDDDQSAPVLSSGEIAIIDTTCREPESGSLFLIEWNGGDREIVETFQRPIGRDGIETLHWWTAAYNRPRSRDELDQAIRRRRPLSTSDGPYAKTEFLARKLIGKVIGVLAPDRHSRTELQRIRKVATCQPHILIDSESTRAPGYVEPAGSARYRGGAV